MFSWEVFNNTTPFTEVEEKVTKAYLRLLIRECPKDGAFLNLLNLDKLKFLWANNMNQSNGVLGAWSLMHGDNIYMAPMDEDNRCTADAIVKRTAEKNGFSEDQCRALLNMQHLFMEGSATTLVHELVHKFQFQTSPVFYIVNRFVTLFADRIPYVERIGIEYDARKCSETEELKHFYECAYMAFDYMTNALINGKLGQDNRIWQAYMDMHSDSFTMFSSVEGPSCAAEVRKYHELVAPLINMIAPNAIV